MEKNEIFETAIRELTEATISKRKETLNDSEQHLYVQGAKDCVELLKKLGVL